MQIDPNKTVFLIDGSAFLYRAYYGMRPLHTKKGVPVHAVYVFCRMIKKIIDQFNPKQMALVWDSKGPTKRHEMYKAYKATRKEPPTDLFQQKEYIVQFAHDIGLYQIAQKGYEADDLMCSLTKQSIESGKSVLLITSDKDMAQLLDEHVFMYDSFKNQIIDREIFEDKMGFSVDKLPFYFALVGDSSDNIPGVKGIGKQGALELVKHFSSLEDLYKNLEKVEKKRLYIALEKDKECAFLSFNLFTLMSCPLDVSDEQLHFDVAHWVRARKLFEELEFTSLLTQMRSLEEKEDKKPFITAKDRGYIFKTITTNEQLNELCGQLKRKKIFAYDTETDGVKTLQSNMVGLSICVQERQAFYIPCAHTTGEKQLCKKEVVKSLKSIFEDATIKKVAHHAKFDHLVMLHAGIQVQGLVFDTMIAAQLVKKDWQRAGLKDLSYYYLDEPMLTFASMVNDKKRADFSQVPIYEATEYAAADAHQAFRLYPLLKEMLVQQDMQSLYYDIELPLIGILAAMEAQGIFCDTHVLNLLCQEVAKKLDHIKRTIVALVGPTYEDINLNSPKQIEHLLFEYLKLPPQKRSTKKTGYSTDNEVLVALAKQHPIPGYIAHYRELFKLKSTYINALPEYINPNTGRIHTTFSQTRVATGRLSSYDPNMQNIPASGIGLHIRAAFKPKKERLFISADYSQIELRVLAHISGDINLQKAFFDNQDIHADTAARLFKVSLSDVTKEQRRVGKRINFSIIYGSTAYGIAKDLGISYKEADQYIACYFKGYPGVKIWMDKVIEETKKNGYVTTLFGRRRFIPGIYEKNKTLFDAACRIAINTKVQGAAAEIMKVGMLSVNKLLQNKKYNAYMLLQIHDEIVISVQKNEERSVEAAVKTRLESVVDWDVPLVANTKIGSNWKEISA